ncbi:uncharacterized protein LTR77_000199 [Saxophila tyrrhenica]|uniref:Uncharacterized protein n=1 Tax=Saxophila tyrrhenica TaxID=1690608 RepID=A0AAV9PQH5_9PEZI|nr:hypothetical protein LTR77_000199 [Saxophila tyrrhenica]
MSRGFGAAGVALAATCGILISYSTLRPELEKQQAERQGDFRQQHHDVNDKALSQAIASDFKEAGEQLKPTPTKGFAWGIREAIFGSPTTHQKESTSSQRESTVQIPARSQDELKESPREVIEKAESAKREGS